MLPVVSCVPHMHNLVSTPCLLSLLSPHPHHTLYAATRVSTLHRYTLWMLSKTNRCSSPSEMQGSWGLGTYKQRGDRTALTRWLEVNFSNSSSMMVHTCKHEEWVLLRISQYWHTFIVCLFVWSTVLSTITIKFGAYVQCWPTASTSFGLENMGVLLSSSQSSQKQHNCQFEMM